MFQVFKIFENGTDAQTGEPKYGTYAASGAHPFSVCERLAHVFKTTDPDNTYVVREAK